MSMRRVAKPEGKFNIVIEVVERPSISETEVLIQTERTLISRGSEIWRRYTRPEAIDHQMMGYSLAGAVVEAGSAVTDVGVGDAVAAIAPHAQYVAVEAVDSAHRPSVVKLPTGVDNEVATFWPLATSSVLWMAETGVQSGQTMVILGQGLVGSGCMQIARAAHGARVIAVDALDLRCDLAAELGADDVVNAATEDPVEAVKRLTDGAGADIVVEAVGGRAGSEAFAQAQDMVKRGGLLQVLGLYEGEPLPLDSGKIQGRRLLGGYVDRDERPQGSLKALAHLAAGEVAATRMITHRFDFVDAAAAFDLLYNRLGETMGVILVW